MRYDLLQAIFALFPNSLVAGAAWQLLAIKTLKKKNLRWSIRINTYLQCKVECLGGGLLGLFGLGLSRGLNLGLDLCLRLGLSL